MWLVVLAALLHALSTAGLANLPSGSIQWLSLFLFSIQLLHSVEHSKRCLWSGFFKGWLFGTVSLAVSTNWLYISMHQYGHMPAWMSLCAVIGLAAGLSLYDAVAAAIFVGIARQFAKMEKIRDRNFPNAVYYLLFAACWCAADLARGQWFTGFPWAVGGYAHVDSAFALLAPWVGVYGIGMVSAGTAMAAARLHYHLRQASILPVIQHAGWLFALLFMFAINVPLRAPDSTRFNGLVSLTLLQGNVKQDEKFGAHALQDANWYQQQILQAQSGLVITPETAQAYIDQSVESWLPVRADQAVLVGMPWQEGNQFSNSALALELNEPPFKYSKVHLVPFGEFVPAMFKWFVDLMTIPMGEFTSGSRQHAIWTWQGQRWAINICYEDLFGEELAQLFQSPEGNPTVLVNMSNIAWFGNTISHDQHLEISRMRAIELQRPVVRSTNTGVTAVIDQNGKVLSQLPVWQRGVLNAQVEGRDGPATIYAQWAGQYGLLPLWLGCLLIFALMSSLLLKQRRKDS